jgi:putative acetyltransferase
MTVAIRSGGLERSDVRALLEHHVRTAREATAPGSAHAFDITALQSADVQFWSAWDGEDLLGVGALRSLSPSHGEIKSMHTAARARRRGIGQLMLSHIIESARTLGLSRLSLETGSWDYFIPARRLYAAHGFSECAPFGDYRADPNSVFMTRLI